MTGQVVTFFLNNCDIFAAMTRDGDLSIDTRALILGDN